MKNRIISLFFLLTILVGVNTSAQDKLSYVGLKVFEPLPEVSFAAFLANPFLGGTPRIFQVVMLPLGVNVTVHGIIQWRRIGESSFNQLYVFDTEPFSSRNFSNDDFSSIGGIKIKDSHSESELLQENLKKGKPTGSYKIIIQVNDGSQVITEEKIIDFLNPSQTLSIIEPRVGDELDVAGILLTWTDVTGVTDFYVKANIRSSKFESLEEALQKGNPLVDENVGIRRSVNLREILKRELVGGEEVVVQIRAVIPGPGGPTILYSDIVNFNLRGTSSPVVDKGVKEFETLIAQVMDDMKKNGGDDDAYNRLQQLLLDIQNGNISFDDIKIRFDSGKQLTYAEFQEILEYLRRNPDLLTSLLFEAK